MRERGGRELEEEGEKGERERGRERDPFKVSCNKSTPK